MHLCGAHLLQKYINLDIVNFVDPVALSIFNTVTGYYSHLITLISFVFSSRHLLSAKKLR